MEPLTQSLLFWGRKGRASSRHRAGCIELYSFQHPVENAKASWEPHHGVYREYWAQGFL